MMLLPILEIVLRRTITRDEVDDIVKRVVRAVEKVTRRI